MKSIEERLALVVPEQRAELGVSVSQLARLAQVSRSTVTKVERGGRVNPALLLRIASALTTIELYAAPEEPAEDTVDALEPVFPFYRPMPGQLALPSLNGAA
jgi:transcriptional regulator with XRE-family HTH domain